VVLRRANAAELIVDGTITANKMNVGSLSAITANLGTVTVGVVQSANFVAGVSGSRLQLSDGAAEFNGPVISRQLQIDIGFFTLPTPISAGRPSELSQAATYWIETNTFSTQWVGAKEAMIALVGQRPGSGYGSVSADSGDVSTQPQNIQWSWVAEVAPLTRWSGNQRIWIKVALWTRLVDQLTGFQLEWKLIKVT
jgi:hypothetical protein